MIEDFRKFIARGNALELAIAVIIGAAFGAITKSVVEDLITPLLGLFGDRNFSDLYLVLKGSLPPETPYEAAKGMAVVLGYGAFITAVIDFLLISAVLFALVKLTNHIQLKKNEEAKTAKAPELTKEEQLLSEIRDLLKERSTPLKVFFGWLINLK